MSSTQGARKFPATIQYTNTVTPTYWSRTGPSPLLYTDAFLKVTSGSQTAEFQLTPDPRIIQALTANANGFFTYIPDSGKYAFSTNEAWSDFDKALGGLPVASFEFRGISGNLTNALTSSVLSGLNAPNGSVVDVSGNIIFADPTNHVIRIIPKRDGICYGVTCSGFVLNTIAGTQGVAGFLNGIVGVGKLSAPSAVAIDLSGNILVADTNNRSVRMIAANPGISGTTYYGTSYCYPNCLATLPVGQCTNGFGDGGDGGVAGTTRINWLNGMSLDLSGNIIFSEYSGNNIRLLATTTGSYYGLSCSGGRSYLLNATHGAVSASQDGTRNPTGASVSGLTFGPGRFVVDNSGNIIFNDLSNSVRIIYGSNGTFYGSTGLLGDMKTIGGTFQVRSIAIDRATGNVFFGTLSSINVISPNGGTIFGVTVPANTNTQIISGLDGIVDALWCDISGNLIMCLRTAGVRILPATTGTFYGASRVANTIGVLTTTPPTISSPAAIYSDSSQNLFIYDAGRYVIYCYPSSTGTFYGTSCTANTLTIIAGTNTLEGGNDGPVGIGRLSQISSIVKDLSGNLIFNSDGYISRICIIPQTSGRWYNVSGLVANSVQTIYGKFDLGFYSPLGIGSNIGGSNGTDGTMAVALPGRLTGIAVDASGNILLTDRDAHKVYVFPTISGANGWYTVNGYDANSKSGNLLQYSLTTIAGASISGAASVPGAAIDGAGANARFNTPIGITTDLSGNILVADSVNHVIRVIPRITSATPASISGYGLPGSILQGNVSTIIGISGSSGTQDGVFGVGRLNTPNGIAVDPSGNVIIADTNNHAIRILPKFSETRYGLSLTNNSLATIAGQKGTSGNVNGISGVSRLNSPIAVSIDGNGWPIISDTGNNSIRVFPAGNTVPRFAPVASPLYYGRSYFNVTLPFFSRVTFDGSVGFGLYAFYSTNPTTTFLINRPIYSEPGNAISWVITNLTTRGYLETTISKVPFTLSTPTTLSETAFSGMGGNYNRSNSSNINEFPDLGTLVFTKPVWELTSGGTRYVVGNNFRIDGSFFGGKSPTNDITISVTGVNSYGAVTSFTVTGTMPAYPITSTVNLDFVDTANYVREASEWTTSTRELKIFNEKRPGTTVVGYGKKEIQQTNQFRFSYLYGQLKAGAGFGGVFESAGPQAPLSNSRFSFTSPASIPNLFSWYDGSDASTLTLSGLDITQWRDKSGNNNHLTKLVATNIYPRKVANVPGNSAGYDIYFDNASIGISGLTTPINSKSLTAFVLIYESVVTNDRFGSPRILATQGPASGCYTIADSVWGAKNYLATKDISPDYYGPNNASPVRTISNSANRYHIISVVFTSNGAGGGTIEFILDGVRNDLFSYSSGDFSFTGFQIGSAFSGNPSTNANINEVITYAEALTPFQRQQVENYIVNKWGITHILPDYSSYNFSIKEFNGLALWLDASDSSSVTLSGATNFVTQWSDKSGNGNHAVQSNSLRRPQYQQNGIYFTSTTFENTNILSIANLNLVSNIPYFGAFAVFNLLQRQTQNYNRASAFFAYRDSSYVFQFTVSDAGASPNSRPRTGIFLSNPDGNSITANDDTNEYSVGNKHLAFGEGNYVSKDVGLYTDGVRRGTSTFNNAGNASPSGSAGFVHVGGSGGSEQSLNNAYIHELILFTRAITTAQRQQIEGYLAWKWGFQESLPSGHPYSTAKP